LLLVLGQEQGQASVLVLEQEWAQEQEPVWVLEPVLVQHNQPLSGLPTARRL